jgi:tetratricopeptide (TPR) repeat protein
MFLRRRTVNATLLAFALVFTATAFWSATTTRLDGDEAANVVAASEGPEAGTGAESPAKKKGGRFARFFKAPFKAAANLFGGGDKVQRMSEKDVAQFESAPLMRVDDARSEPRARAGGGGTEARDYLARGRELLEAGRLNEAIEELSRAVSLDRRLSQAHNLLAVAYDRKGLKERARESFERGLDKGDAQSLNNVGYWLYTNGNYRAAVERLKLAARLAPADERVLNNLALAQARLGKFDDAYRSFARAAGEFDGHMNVAALAERTGRDAEAIEHYEAARRVRPDSETAARRLADLYARNGRGDEAARARRQYEGAPALAARE